MSISWPHRRAGYTAASPTARCCAWCARSPIVRRSRSSARCRRSGGRLRKRLRGGRRPADGWRCGKPLAPTHVEGVAAMNRLTVDERRRANELRRLSTTLGAPRALAVEELGERTGAGWGRNARLATLITVILGGVLALLQLAQTLSLYGPGSLLDWLLPRL